MRDLPNRPSWQRELIALEDGTKFGGTPNRWLDAAPVRFRCDNDHVSTHGLRRSKGAKFVCLADGCGLPLWVTAPEDPLR